MDDDAPQKKNNIEGVTTWTLYLSAQYLGEIEETDSSGHGSNIVGNN